MMSESNMSRFFGLFSLLVFATASNLWGQQTTPADPCREAVGIVRLKVELLANGKVSTVTPLSTLPFGLTDEAIKAARQIKFEPKKVNGVPQNSTVTMEYSFSISFDEASPDLLSKAVILDIPKPKISPRKSAGLPDEVEISVSLNQDHKPDVLKFITPVPDELKDPIKDAVSKIKFKPAIHRCGMPVTEETTIRLRIR